MGEMHSGPMHEKMKHEHMHRGMKAAWMMKFLSEEDKKKIAVKKLEMKIAQKEQYIELLKLMRDMIKSKIEV
jgi:hypothetical protein